jgi:hypothetical protein
VGFRWEKLARYLAQRFGSQGANIIEETRRRRNERSLSAAIRFLSAKDVPNAHRFLRPLKINNEIRFALRSWAERFVTLVPELPTK